MNRVFSVLREIHEREDGFFGIDIAISALSAIGGAIASAAAAAASATMAAGTAVAGAVGTAGSAIGSAAGSVGSAVGGMFGAGGGAVSAGAGGVYGTGMGMGAQAVGMSGMQIGSLVATGVGTVASAATSIYSGYAQARQEKAMGKAQERFASYNAEVAEAQAATERQSGRATLRDARIRGEQIREKFRYVKGAQQAALAKSGVVASSGTPLLVAQEEAMRGKLEQLDEIWKGKMAKREFDIRAGYYENEAASQRMQGSFARKLGSERARNSILSGYVSAGTSLLGGGAEFFGQYNKYKGNEPMSQYGVT